MAEELSHTNRPFQEVPADSNETISAKPTPVKPSGPLKEAIAGFFSARLELATIEAKEAAGFGVKKVIIALLMAICTFFTWGLLMLAIAALMAPLFDRLFTAKISWLSGWVIALFTLSLLHALVAAICAILLKKKSPVPLFELSRIEFQNDKQWLKKNK